MKLLLDESIPRKLSGLFPEAIEISSVPEMGWAGTKNGQLLTLAAEHEFTALVTADRGIEYQQNLANLPITIVVLVAYRTRFDDLAPLIPKVMGLLKT